MCGNVVERVECIGITSFSVLPFVCLFILFTLLSGGLSPSADVQGDWSIYYDCFCLTFFFFVFLSCPHRWETVEVTDPRCGIFPFIY